MKKIIENIIYILNLILGAILLVSLFIDLKKEFLTSIYIWYIIIFIGLSLYDFIVRLIKK